MTFSRAEPNTNYRIVRLVSGGGRWELGLSHYARGVRIRMGLSGRPPSVIDFCLGGESSLYTPALLAVLSLLESAPESAPPEEIDALFPWAGTRPDLESHLAPLIARGHVPKEPPQQEMSRR